MPDDPMMTCPNPACGWIGGLSETAADDNEETAELSGILDARFCPDCGTQVEFTSEVSR